MLAEDVENYKKALTSRENIEQKLNTLAELSQGNPPGTSRNISMSRRASIEDLSMRANNRTQETHFDDHLKTRLK